MKIARTSPQPQTAPYAGHAQRDLELACPGATALFVTGCGGDQNPYPRRADTPGMKPGDLVRDHRRVIEEGGYEGLSANTRLLNHPGRFADNAEDTVVAKVHELVRQTRP